MGLLDHVEKALLEAKKAGEPLERLIKEDEVAAKTSWKAIGASSLRRSSHDCVEVSPVRVEFKPKLSALLVTTLFMLSTVGIVFTVVSKVLELEPVILYGLSAVAAILVSFVLIGLYRGMTPVVFDRGEGLFWKRRKQPDSNEITDSDSACRLSDIYAVQLIRKSHTSGSSTSGSSSVSYQLNLVKKDGNRLNVTSSQSKSQQQSNAEALSKFLNVPVWEFSTYTAM